MTDSFVLVASVLAALSIGLGIAATAWWLSARGQAGSGADAAGTASIATRKPLVLLVAAAGLLASVGVLYVLGDGAASPKAAGAPVAAGATPALSALAASLNQGGAVAGATPASPKGGDLDVMTERLAKRLRERTPDDHESWALLARSYVELGRDSDAVAAFERSGPLLKSDPALKAELDAVKLRIVAPTKSGAAAVTTGAPAGATASTTSGVAAPAGPPVLAGTVDVSPALKARLPAKGFIFIIARAEGGPPGAPLAAKRIAMTALPMRFELTDADSMLPGQKLSGVKTVALSARVSETGDAAPSPGALESAREAIAVGRKDIALVLTTRRE
jgi:cytochrome c-type biogenesis protein CcmH